MNSDALEWLESPRMRCQAIGFATYSLQLLTGILTFAGLFLLIAMLYGWSQHPQWWLHHRVTDLTELAGMGAMLGLWAGVMPAKVHLSSFRLVKRSALGTSEYLFSACLHVHCEATPANLKLEMEMRNGNRTEPRLRIVTIVPARYRDRALAMLKDHQ